MMAVGCWLLGFGLRGIVDGEVGAYLSGVCMGLGWGAACWRQSLRRWS